MRSRNLLRKLESFRHKNSSDYYSSSSVMHQPLIAGARAVDGKRRRTSPAGMNVQVGGGPSSRLGEVCAYVRGGGVGGGGYKQWS